LKKGEVIAILDFGGQYCHLIARRIRELGVYTEIFDGCTKLGRSVGGMEIKGIVLSGGPKSVYEKDAPKIDRKLLEGAIPILGICYGHQLIALIAGGKVLKAPGREYGVVEADVVEPVGVLDGLGPKERVWMSHSDSVVEIPKEYKVLARTKSCPVAAMKHRSKPIYGLQWHPEVSHTESGIEMLGNFVFKVCKCSKSWTSADYVGRAVKEVRESVGKGRAIIALSGGVDSSTAAVLAARAIGKNLTAIFVDHGFMRKGEPEFIEKTFRNMGVKVTTVRARKRFMRKISGVDDPERKRKLIGEEFIKIFEEEARKVGADFLIQGTIYPDRIESGIKRHSEKIKTHHNVGGLPAKVKFKAIVEPLRELYKDEVRRVAETLGLPKEIALRQPFPGPGLAVRIVGEVTEEKVEIVRRANSIVEEELGKLPGNKLWQYFAILTNSMSTGVKGDSRAYGYTVAVRAVQSSDGMTANFAKIPYGVLEKISSRIVNEIPEVTRVVYDITHKPPATIEWE